MRHILRSLLVSYIAIYATQRVVGGFRFEGNSIQTMFLVIVAVALLNTFMIPVFKIISLPHRGFSFIFLSSILTFVIFYVLTLFIPAFSIQATELVQLRIFGVVLPSRHLTQTWSAVYSALLVSIIYHFFEWLCGKR